VTRKAVGDKSYSSRWRGIGWPGFATVTGTMPAVMETGDLRLLSGDLRRSLTAYSTELRRTPQAFLGIRSTWTACSGSVWWRLDFAKFSRRNANGLRGG
jgi:hypothetical protein